MYGPPGVKTAKDMPVPDTMRANNDHLSLMREQVVSAVRALSAELGAHGSKSSSRVAAE